MCFSIFRGLTDRPVQAQTSWNAALKNLHLSQRWITGYICFPSEYLCGRGVWAHNRLGQAGIQKVQRAHIHAWTLQSTACTYVNSCIQMTTSLFKRSDAQAWIHRERVRSVVSLALVWSLSLSLSLCPFFFFHVLVLPHVLPVWAPPTHPSVPIRALRPRVHLASSSVSVELSPTTATTDSLNAPASLFWEYTHTHTQNAYEFSDLSFNSRLCVHSQKYTTI